MTARLNKEHFAFARDNLADIISFLRVYGDNDEAAEFCEAVIREAFDAFKHYAGRDDARRLLGELMFKELKPDGGCNAQQGRPAA